MGRASEWRAAGVAAARDKAVELTLPSGAKILARRPDPEKLAIWVRLPFSLSGEVLGGKTPEQFAQRMSAQELFDLASSLRDVLVWCCVDPRVSLDARGPGEIHPRDIPDEDLHFIFRWAMRGEEVAQFSRFRKERADAGAGADGADVRAETVGPAGD
ncbi:MAG TPA: hypothetical protein VN442_18510 [Bryobacteraceae bacterium]|nr:hypothetical protein [Bryobacteraceae bacterium]